MRIILILFVIYELSSNGFCEKFRFDNYSLYKILPTTDDHIKVLQDLQNEDPYLDFWKDPTPKVPFVMVLSSPDKKPKLENFLSQHGMDFEITIPNVQENIDKETVREYTRNNNGSMSWDTYYTLDGINNWIAQLINQYPNIVSGIVGGYSYEGRPILGIKISHGPGRRAVVLEAGIHAREWISPAATNFIANELLSSDDEMTKSAARDYDWYIFPVTNPDGYVWSYKEFRMWRKNRRPIGVHFGVDLNRNWNSNWLRFGASTNPISNTYAGTGPFSEPETRSLSEYLRTIKDMDYYLSIHSWGQMLLVPFGNTTEPLDNYHDAVNIGRRAMGALSVRYGTNYTTGNIAEVLYFATGGSDEWVKEHLHVPFVYCYELRDSGEHGFLLPPEQIRPTGEETLDSIVDLLFQARRFGLVSSSGHVKVSLLIMLTSILMLSVI